MWTPARCVPQRSAFHFLFFLLLCYPPCNHLFWSVLLSACSVQVRVKNVFLPLFLEVFSEFSEIFLQMGALRCKVLIAQTDKWRSWAFSFQGWHILPTAHILPQAVVPMANLLLLSIQFPSLLILISLDILIQLENMYFSPIFLRHLQALLNIAH